MSNYKKILVAIDVSDESAQVLRAAIEVAKDGGEAAEISVIHVAENFLASYSMYGYNPAIDEQNLQRLIGDELAAIVDTAGLDPDCLNLVSGRAADIIVQQAEQQGCDLIVLGSHGRHGVKLLLGSTANAVLHRAYCDVLAVRIKAP